MPTARDGCAVETGPLSVLLSHFVSSWNRTRPPTGGQFSGQQRRPGATSQTHSLAISAVPWLAERTGIPERTIENIVSARYRLVEFGVADRLVTAIGRTEAFHDGTLHVQPNPLAKLEAQAECCGGSLNGAVEAGPGPGPTVVVARVATGSRVARPSQRRLTRAAG